MMSRKSDLPFGSEFSPSQIDLAHVLELAELHGGDRRAFENAVRAAYFEGHATSAYNRGKLANNTRLGMIAYGIIDRDANLIDFGHELSALKDDEPALYQRLAKHILLNLHGMTLVRCIQDMVAAGEAASLTTLRNGLAARGVHYPSGGKHPSMMRLWLAKAGGVCRDSLADQHPPRRRHSRTEPRRVCRPRRLHARTARLLARAGQYRHDGPAARQ